MSLYKKVGLRPSKPSQIIVAVFMLIVVFLTGLAVTRGQWILLPIGILVLGLALFQFVGYGKKD